jgi:hypothetical protein
MKLSRSLVAIGILISGTTFAAYAAVDNARAFAPPTAVELGLSGAYVAQWNDLRGETLSLRSSARNSGLQRITRLRQLLATSKPDLDAFNRDAERAGDDFLAKERALKAKKIAFYDSLPPAQQAQVRKVLSDRLERLQNLPFFNQAINDSQP